MKWLLRILDSQRTAFQEGGKLHRLKPVFDATESFFFSPPERTADAPTCATPWT